MTILNVTQIFAATELRADRPPVLPGTNVILNDEARLRWFNTVTRRMDSTGIKTHAQMTEFCNLAGVPD